MGANKAKGENAARTWPAAKVELRRIEDLVPYVRNAKKHPPEQIASIAASIKKWGWTMPVLVDESGMILAGAGRILGAKHLGLEEAPVSTAVGWTDAEKRAYILADNRIAEQSGWDRELLSLELAELDACDFDLKLTGFDADGSGDGEHVERVSVPKPITFAWAIIGVPIGDMGRLQQMVETAQAIEGAIVEVCDDGRA